MTMEHWPVLQRTWRIARIMGEAVRNRCQSRSVKHIPSRTDHKRPCDTIHACRERRDCAIEGRLSHKILDIEGFGQASRLSQSFLKRAIDRVSTESEKGWAGERCLEYIIELDITSIASLWSRLTNCC